MIYRKISYNLKLTESTIAKVNTLLDGNTRYSKKYPWEGLEVYLENQNETTLKIIGYGSLINAQSAALTVRAQKRTPVMAFGVFRVFNYVISKNNARYGVFDNPRQRAALNIRVTNKVSDFINGLLIEVPVSDIQALREREIAYDLIQVPCIMWDNLNCEPFYAYILYCPYKEFDGKEKTSNIIEPHTAFYQVCREGAQSFGDNFLKCWKSTTFLADGKTSMEIWEKENEFL
ncbi:MAG: hypothetical protein K8S16_02420 [Bacteroidales bacterium]|nr:hypothetical protein [Bacteroidales bacterium]